MLSTLSLSTVFLFSAVATPQSVSPLEVLRVERREAFAGKLGQRVTQRLWVRADNRTLSISIPMGHTRFGSVPTFRVGDLIQKSDRNSFGWIVVGRSK